MFLEEFSVGITRYAYTKSRSKSHIDLIQPKGLAQLVNYSSVSMMTHTGKIPQIIKTNSWK